MRLLIALPIAAVAVSTAAAFHAAAAEADGDEPSADTKPTARVVIATKDYLQGTDFALTDEAATLATTYSGKVTINRKVIAGVSFGLGHDDEILGASGERDVVYLKSGDKVSGEVLKLMRIARRLLPPFAISYAGWCGRTSALRGPSGKKR